MVNMNFNRINKFNFLSLCLFFISPILGVLFSILSLKNTVNRRFLYIILSLFSGLVCLKNPPLHDAYRYYERFNNIKSFSDIGVYTGDYFFDFVSILFNNLDIPFYFVPSFFVFLTLYISFHALEIIINKYNFSKKNQLFLIFSILILSNPIMISMGLRSYLAFSFLLYGSFLFIFTKSKLFIIYIFLACITHASFFIFILPLILAKFYAPNKIILFLLSMFFFVFSDLIFNYFANISAVSFVFGGLIGYGDFNNLEGKSERGLLFYYMVLYLKLFFIYYSYLTISKEKLDKHEIFLYNYIGYIILIFSVCSLSEVALGRYTGYAAVFVYFICFISIVKNRSKEKIKMLVLIFFILFNFVVLNIYVNRNIFYIGKPISMALITPLQITLYSKHKYDLYLNHIEYDGYPKDSLKSN